MYVHVFYCTVLYISEVSIMYIVDTMEKSYFVN